MDKTCAYCNGPIPKSKGKKPRTYCSARCVRYAYYWRNPQRENERGKRWRAANPEKYKACKERWNKAHPEAVLRHARRARLLWEYGLTHEQYQQMLERCGGLCEICREPMPKGGNLNVDHCHARNKVRGLLCDNCNRGLGAFRDNTELLARAIEYLRRHAA